MSQTGAESKSIGLKLAENKRKQIEEENNSPFFKLETDEYKNEEDAYFKE